MYFIMYSSALFAVQNKDHVREMTNTLFLYSVYELSITLTQCLQFQIY